MLKLARHLALTLILHYLDPLKPQEILESCEGLDT